jgi:hypothetical protein
LYNNEMMNFAGQYGKPHPDNWDDFESYGHFTQIVWKDSKTVGCAVYNCPNGIIDAKTGKSTGTAPFYTVCNFKPPGKFMPPPALVSFANLANRQL